MKIVTGLILITLILSCGGGMEVNVEDEKVIIAQVIHDSIGWAKNKDTELLYRCFAQDEDLFWFTPEASGTTRGIDSFKETVNTLFLNPAFEAVRFEIRDLAINLSRSGDVAWYSCVLDDENTWNGAPASWLNTRWTGVIEKREGSWTIVQMHFSYGTGAEG